MIMSPQEGPRRLKIRLWPGMIFALIGLNFCIVGVTIYAAGRRGSSHAIEPDYDRKALNWNQAARQVAHNTELGWTLRLDSIEAGIISATLLDRQGQPITGANIAVEAFHHAHAGDKLHATLTSASANNYRAGLAVNQAGLWEFRFTVRHQGEVFTSTLTRIITEGQS